MFQRYILEALIQGFVFYLSIYLMPNAANFRERNAKINHI